MTEARYVGDELELFAQAATWKRYLRRQIAPFLGSRVLEVGAGIGATTRVFASGGFEEWVCLEPDATMADRLREAIAHGDLPACCRVVTGTVETPAPGPYDTVLYIDVLEHIEHDREELQRAAALVVHGGSLVVLSPAHQWLYTPFDRSIGHFRRYTKANLSAIAPPDLRLARLRYLDSAGLLSSAANRLALQQSMPTLRQVLFWDRLLVRASTVIDPLTGFHLGKSILAVWQRPIVPDIERSRDSGR